MNGFCEGSRPFTRLSAMIDFVLFHVVAQVFRDIIHTENI